MSINELQEAQTQENHTSFWERAEHLMALSAAWGTVVLIVIYLFTVLARYFRPDSGSLQEIAWGLLALGVAGTLLTFFISMHRWGRLLLIVICGAAAFLLGPWASTAVDKFYFRCHAEAFNRAAQSVTTIQAGGTAPPEYPRLLHDLKVKDVRVYDESIWFVMQQTSVIWEERDFIFDRREGLGDTTTYIWASKSGRICKGWYTFSWFTD